MPLTQSTFRKATADEQNLLTSMQNAHAQTEQNRAETETIKDEAETIKGAIQADRAVVQGFRDETEQHALGAEAAKVASEQVQQNVEAIQHDVEAHATLAVNAADVASNSAHGGYNTKAEAEADLANIPAGATVEVLQDESRTGSPLSVYRKESGALAYKLSKAGLNASGFPREFVNIINEAEGTDQYNDYVLGLVNSAGNSIRRFSYEDLRQAVVVRARATAAQIAGADSIKALIEQAAMDAMDGVKLVRLGSGLWRYDETATFESCSGLAILTDGLATVIKPDAGIDNGSGIGSPFYFKGTAGARLKNIVLGSYKLERTGAGGYARLEYCDDSIVGDIVGEGGANSCVSGSNSRRVIVGSIVAKDLTAGGSCVSLRDCERWLVGNLHAEGGTEAVDLFRSDNNTFGNVSGVGVTNEVIDCGGSSYNKFGRVTGKDCPSRVVSMKVEAGVSTVGNEIDSIRSENHGTAGVENPAVFFAQESGAEAENHSHHIGKVVIETAVAASKGVVVRGTAPYPFPDISIEEVQISVPGIGIEADFAHRINVGFGKVVSTGDRAVKLNSTEDHALGSKGHLRTESQGTAATDDAILLQQCPRGLLGDVHAESASGHGIQALQCTDLALGRAIGISNDETATKKNGGYFDRCDGLKLGRSEFIAQSGVGLNCVDNSERDWLGLSLEFVKATSTSEVGAWITGIRRVRGTIEVTGGLSGLRMSYIKDVRLNMPTARDCGQHGIWILIVNSEDWDGDVDIEIAHARVSDIGKAITNTYSAFRVENSSATPAKGIRLHRGYVHDLAEAPTSRVAQWVGAFSGCEDTVEFDADHVAGQRTGSLAAASHVTMDGLRHGKADLIADPAGGSTIDAECRTQLALLVDKMIAAGLMRAS